MEHLPDISYNGGMKPPPKVDLAQLCREVRDDLGCTQEEMAKLLGTTARSYRRWETGELEPGGQFTAKLFILKQDMEAKKARGKQ